MKKGLIYIMVIALLGVGAWYVIKENKNNSSIASIEAEYAFGIADTNAITKIIIRDKTPNEAILTRENGRWFVNGKDEARPGAVKVLLETMNRQTMRNFVPIAREKSIIEDISVYGKEVEVYAGDEKIKHFYVGIETDDQTATYMMIKGASKPFSVHIEGFVGYLNTRYFADARLWRRRILFGLPKNDIARVDMRYSDPSFSFSVDNTGDEPRIEDVNGQVIANALPPNYNIFLGSFRTASYEGDVVETDGIWPKLDSIKMAEPQFVLAVTDKEGETQTLKAFHKRPDKEQVGDDGEWLEWDPDRLYALLDDGRWVVIQYFGLRNIIVDKNFFFTELRMEN